MGNSLSSSSPKVKETQEEKLHAYCARLEVDAALIRKSQASCERDARARYAEGHMEAARARFAHAKHYRQQELQIIQTITLVQQNILQINSARLGKESLDIMRSSARSLHAASLNPDEIDKVSDALHDQRDDITGNMERFAEHTIQPDDDDEWAAFIATIDTEKPPEEPTPPPSNTMHLEVPTDPLPKVPAYTEQADPPPPPVVATPIF